MSRWIVSITQKAKEQLASITDRRVQEAIVQRINNLEFDPDKQGKNLRGELADFRSVRAVGQRYRILYKVEAERVTIIVVALGIRKEGDRADVYELARKLARLGLLGDE